MKFKEFTTTKFFTNPEVSDRGVHVKVIVNGQNEEDVRDVLDKINIDDWKKDDRKWTLKWKELGKKECIVFFSLE